MQKIFWKILISKIYLQKSVNYVVSKLDQLNMTATEELRTRMLSKRSNMK